MKIVYKSALTINSAILLFAVYAIKEKMVIPLKLLPSEYCSYLLYIVAIILFSAICLLLTRFLGKDTIEGGVNDVENANNSYLPSYLGYFFVALSVDDFTTLCCVFLLICMFTYNSQALLFNPMFLLFGYNFYYVTIDNGIKIFVISKHNLRSVKNMKFSDLRRINDYTFIDRRK